MYKRAPKVCYDGPLETHGHIWSQEIGEHGPRWRRLLIRQYARTGEIVMQDLTYLDPTLPYCEQCLSHAVQTYAYGAAHWVECHICGAFYTPDP